MTTRRTVSLLAASALLALSPVGARADEAAVKEKPPEPDAPRPFKLPAPNR